MKDLCWLRRAWLIMTVRPNISMPALKTLVSNMCSTASWVFWMLARNAAVCKQPPEAKALSGHSLEPPLCIRYTQNLISLRPNGWSGRTNDLLLCGFFPYLVGFFVKRTDRMVASVQDRHKNIRLWIKLRIILHRPIVSTWWLRQQASGCWESITRNYIGLLLFVTFIDIFNMFSPSW